MRIAFLLLVSAFLLAGCVVPEEPAQPTATPSPSPAIDENADGGATPIPTATPKSYGYYDGGGDVPPAPPSDGPPSIKTTARPSNPDRGETFTLTVSSEDDVGVKTLSWESPDAFSKQPETNSFDCGGQKNCSISWEFISSQEGLKKITVYATDSSGHESARVPIEISVRPFDYKPRPSASPTPSAPWCGNGACDAGEANEICAKDCPFEGPKCANGKCEGGESYESCPADCSVSAIVGSRCNDGACEPGEDAKNCPNDCTAIKPNCGNSICDAWENYASCLKDCESGSSTTKCTSNEQCGYKEICQSGSCVSVQCTNDAQCGYGKECESNRCVRCPRGPYGYAC